VILFCDTSALIKLLIDEPGSDQMQRASAASEAIPVCRITWAEAMTGMARRSREDPISADAIELARQRLMQTWAAFSIVEVNQELGETAGRFADGFALRAYDNVQLAAAHLLDVNTEQPLIFASYDRRVNQAAQLLQLEVLP
jgi:predicted nucleic acid-binding protein